jgi:hypothetical protein
VFVFARVATDGSFRVLADSLVTGLRRENRYLDNDDEHQRDLIPNGRDLLLARVLPPDTAAATPLRLILQEGAIPAPGGEAVSTAGDRLVSSFV